MCKRLPLKDFEWINDFELKNWRKILNAVGKGCVLEVDLHYPEHLHADHNDYPLAPERLKINGVEKLVPNHQDKKNMVLHAKSLQQYLDFGLELTKIHAGVKFTEKDYMKPFIELNTKMRTQAKNAFEKDFYKLMSNSVYGKTLENVRNRQNVVITNDPLKKKKLVSEINFKSVTHFNSNLAAVHMGKTEIELNKPVYCGASILDFSKHHMFHYHYNYAKKKWKGLKTLYTDTDSFIYEIPAENLFQDIAPDVEEWYDTSGYPLDFPHLPTGKNKKVLGVFKDECGGKIMTEFVALRAKCYSYLLEGGKNDKRVKGVKKNVKKINHA